MCVRACVWFMMCGCGWVGGRIMDVCVCERESEGVCVHVVNAVCVWVGGWHDNGCVCDRDKGF